MAWGLPADICRPREKGHLPEHSPVLACPAASPVFSESSRAACEPFGGSGHGGRAGWVRKSMHKQIYAAAMQCFECPWPALQGPSCFSVDDFRSKSTMCQVVGECYHTAPSQYSFSCGLLWVVQQLFQLPCVSFKTRIQSRPVPGCGRSEPDSTAAFVKHSWAGICVLCWCFCSQALAVSAYIRTVWAFIVLRNRARRAITHKCFRL